jgi:hypothetical protein
MAREARYMACNAIENNRVDIHCLVSFGIHIILFATKSHSVMDHPPPWHHSSEEEGIMRVRAPRQNAANSVQHIRSPYVYITV